MGGKLSIKSHYTPLAIITNKEWKDKEKELKEPDRRPTTHETIFQPKEPIFLENLFEREELKNALKKRLLIQGSAGIGKSTLCQRIAYEWAQEEKWLGRFRAVFWVKFRDINSTKFPPRPERGYTIYEVLAKLLGFELGQIEKLLEDKKLRENCLLILDGYDEISDERLDFQISGKGDFQVLKAFQEEFPHVIVTTRPQSMPGFQRSLELEILGFEDEAIDKYAESFFRLSEEISKEEQAKKQNGESILKVQLEHPLVRSLCHIPINLEIFCSLALAGEIFPADRFLGIAQIYDQLTNWLMKRFLKPQFDHAADVLEHPYPQRDENVVTIAKNLQELAWKGIEWNKIFFDIKSAEIKEILFKKIYHITKIRKLGPFRIDEKEGLFIHLTFQEFFAAKYLARLFLDGKPKNLTKATQIIAEKKFHPRFQLVFSMTSGLLAQERNQEVLRQFFDMLFASPRDLEKSGEAILFARCFEECGDGAKKIAQYEEFIENVVKLLEHTSIRFELLNKNQSLLASDKIVDFFLQKLKKMDICVLLSLQILAEQKNRFPKSLTEGILSRIVDWHSDPSVAEIDEMMRGPAAMALGQIVKAGYALPEEAKMLVDLFSDPSTDGSVRILVAETLGEIAKAGYALPEEAKILVDLFSDPSTDGSVRTLAAKTLGEIVEAGHALPEGILRTLIDSLSDLSTDGFVRGRAAWILGQIVKAGHVFPEEALRALVDFLSDLKVNGSVRILAAEALRGVVKAGHALPEWALKALVDSLADPNTDGSVRERAAKALWEFVKAGHALPGGTLGILRALVDSLSDPNADVFVRERAADTFKEAVKAGHSLPERTLKALVNLFSDLSIDGSIRGQAAEALRGIVKAGHALPEGTLKALVDSLADPNTDGSVRERAAFAFMEIVKAGYALPEGILRTLIDSFSDPSIDGFVRGRAAWILGQIVKAGHVLPEEAIRALVDFLSDPSTDDSERRWAVEVLGKIVKAGGVYSAKALNELIKCLSDPNASGSVCGRTITTLEEIVKAGHALPEEALRVLTDLFLDSSVDGIVRGRATEVLGKIVKAGGIHSEKALNELIKCLSDPNADASARRWAVDVLGRIVKAGGIHSAKALNELINCLSDPNADGSLREQAIKTLKTRVEAGYALPEEVLQAMIDCLSDQNANIYSDDLMKSILQHTIGGGFIYPKDFIEHICKISGMAFYQTNDQYYVAYERDVYPIKIAPAE